MKKQDTTKPKTRAELRAQLAHDLAVVLNNPSLPKPVFEGIVDGLNEHFSCLSDNAQHYINTSEDYIRLVLEAETKGGAR